MKKQLEVEVKFSEKDIRTILENQAISKSKKMVALFDLGLETKEISDIMTTFEGKLVRYNFVYNVLSNHCAVNGVQIEKSPERTGKKDLILEMFLAGKSNKEISIDLKTNYNYVFNTIKQFKQLNPTWESMVQKPSAVPAAQAE